MVPYRVPLSPGWGGAGKREVERMVHALVDIDRPVRPADAADAVALALCHLARAPQLRAVARAEERQPLRAIP